jgi:RNA polymerase sigma factor (sigma-70 family)
MKSAPAWLVRTACIVGFQIRRDLDPSRQAQVPADLSTRIADALRHLPTEQRVILELAYRFKCSREDIARGLNCSVETVMTQMSEGTKALRQIIR